MLTPPAGRIENIALRSESSCRAAEGTWRRSTGCEAASKCRSRDLLSVTVRYWSAAAMSIHATNHRRTCVGNFDSPAKEKRSEECTSERCLLMCHAAVKTDSRAGWRITVVLSGQIPTHTGSCTKQKPGEAAATTRCSATTSAESAPT